MATPSVHDVERSRIVVVDDNRPSADLVKALLGRAGMSSVELINVPGELLERYDELNPHLIVLDLHMPGIDGYTVLAEMRGRASVADLPILVLTADTTRDATHRALTLGASDFLTKPIDAVELTLRVRNLLMARAAHEGVVQRQRWLEASAELAAELLSGQGSDPPRRLCELALAAADADCALILGTAPIQAKNTIAAGALTQADADELAAALSGAPLGSSGSIVVDAPRALGVEPGLWAGPLLIARLGADSLRSGALVLGRVAGRPTFTDAERVLAGGFAEQAALAVELAAARADQERMLVLHDRHRIARDLHDHVIQRLFAAGLRLQQVSKGLAPGPVADQVKEHLEELDDTISEIRSTVFGLRRATSSRGPNRLYDHLEELGRDLATVLGFEPQVAVDVQSGRQVDADIAEDLMAAAREALTNVARHAHAHRVELSVRVSEWEVVLEVVDDGVGMADADRHSGLMNLSERAHRHDGTCQVSKAANGGTRLLWRVPLADGQQVGAAT